MDIMTVFNAVIVLFGVYMVISSLYMKKSGKISSTVIAAEEIKACRNKEEFISYIYWKEALFGGIMIIVGILGLVNDLIVSLGVVNIVEMIVFLFAFFWFQNEMKKAREKFF